MEKYSSVLGKNYKSLFIMSLHFQKSQYGYSYFSWGVK